jgi:hypothetical protein
MSRSNPCLEIKVPARPVERLETDQAWAAGLDDTDLAIVVKTGVLNGFVVGDGYLAAAHEELSSRQRERDIKPGEIVDMSGRRYEYVCDTSEGPDSARVMVPFDEVARDVWRKKYATGAGAYAVDEPTMTRITETFTRTALRGFTVPEDKARPAGNVSLPVNDDVPGKIGPVTVGITPEVEVAFREAGVRERIALLRAELERRGIGVEKPIDFDVYNGFKKRGV